MKMFNRAICLFVLVFTFLNMNKTVYAAEYVLPYPSYMPGNKFYKISRILDRIERWWFWGSIASFKYHLKLADRYLVEAKILFEYKQYLLAADALKRSDSQVLLIKHSLLSAQTEGKDTNKLELLGKNAMNAHITILEKLKKELPENFLWTPEKQPSRMIHIFELIDKSIAYRSKLLE